MTSTGPPERNRFPFWVGKDNFSRHPDDPKLLSDLARFAEAVHAPFLAAVAPGMFGCEDFGELAGLSAAAVCEIAARAGQHGGWAASQVDSAVRYVCLAWPGLQHELSDGERQPSNPAFALAAIFASAFRSDRV